MSGREHGHELPPHADPETLEVAPGTEHPELQGWRCEAHSERELRDAIEKAFDYRGNITIVRRDGSSVEGYIFDRREGKDLSDSELRVMPAAGGKMTLQYSDIAALAFTGRDTAAGKSWESWVKKHWEKRRAGEKNIGIEPEKLE